MNPLIQNSPLSQLIGAIRNNNPQQLAQNILSQNPQAQVFMNQMQNACGNQDPREFVLSTCKANGIDTSQVMQLAGMLGLK